MGMVRPRKNKADKRAYTLQVKLTERERTEIEREASRVGTDVSTWVRQKILELIRQKS